MMGLYFTRVWFYGGEKTWSDKVDGLSRNPYIHNVISEDEK